MWLEKFGDADKLGGARNAAAGPSGTRSQ